MSPNTDAVPSVRKRSELLIFGALLALALIVPATASAAIPTIKFEKKQPATALLGTAQKIELFAEDPEGQPRGFNLSFRDVLPKGVTYVGGASIAPSAVIANKPAEGETTLIFENVADLSPRSSFAVTFEVEPSHTIFKLAGEKNRYTDKAQAFISERPRRKPNFDKTTGKWLETPEEKAVIAATEKSASTELTAIKIEKSEPSPEGEILRGVHEHQTVYTLTVRNNHIGPTEGLTGQGAVGSPKKSIIVEDWLPAGLEFLGCGKADNTTNTETNPGSKEEYPGSGVIDPGHAPATEHCIEPFYVKTEAEVQPPGTKMPKGTYTHVKWEGPESLETSGKFEIQYIAAIPLRKNTTTWLGAEPAAEGGGVKQIANLNNNTGGETIDEEVLKNNAQARGKYEATEVKDNFELERTAEDLAIQKGNSEQGKIFDGAETNWTLKLETSEYRRSEPVSITDQLPNGLCPIGPKGYEGPIQNTPTQPRAECAASGTRHPTVRYVKGGPTGKVGSEEQIEYSLAEEEATGGFKLEFNGPEVAALSRMEPSQELLITFPTTTRVFYQENFEDGKPILTGDSWTNTVSTEAPSYTRCYVEPTLGTFEADPNCEKPATKPIASVRPDGTKVLDLSSASQEAGGVEIEKSVRKNVGLAPAKCEDASTDYVKGLLSKEAALPKYRPGDQICWRLVVKFPSNIYAGKPVVTDFIPTDEELVQGSEVEGPANTVESTLNETAAKEELLEWTLGKTEAVESSRLFEVRFKTKVASTTSSEPGEISGNLMKFTYANSKGVTFPLRDRSEIVREEPNLELTKAVASVNGGAASTTVKGGDKVKYAIKLPNTKGTLKAEEIEVWDNLPAGTTCANLEGAPSNGGACTNGRIVWTGLSVEAGATGEVSYTMVVPADVAPGHKYENTAGVVKYKSETNTGEKFTYIPTNNIAGAEAGTPNAGEARGSAAVTTTGATVTKTAKAPLEQAGNSATQATIGELVEYEVTTKVPANSTLYGTPVLKDAIPAGIEFEKGSASAELGGVKLPTGGLTLKENEVGGAITSVEVKFPETFATGATESKLTVTFKGRVKNISANVRGVEITNTAALTFKDKVVKEGETAPTREAKGSVKTPLVEPELKVYKTQSTTGVVKPGEQITYTVSAEDVAGRSAANKVILVDTVPIGMKVVGGLEGGVYNPTTRKITWELGTVNPGAVSAANTRTYKLEVENPAKAASVFKNEVIGTTQSLPTTEGAPGRTSTFKEGSYEAAKSGYEASAKQESHLTGTTIVKEVTPEEGTIGTPLRYTLRLKLLPGIEYPNTTVVDTLPDGVAFDKTLSTEIVEGATMTPTGKLLPASPEGTPQRVGWYFGFLPASAGEREAVVVFEAHVKGKTSAGTEVKKGAELVNSVVGLYGLYNGEEKAEPTTVPTPGAGSGYAEQTSPATAKTTVAEPSLTIAKSVKVEPGGGTGPKVQPGSTFTYKLVVTNSGNWPAYNAKVTDTNPQADLREIVPVTNPAATVLTTSPLSWEIATIPAGGSVTLEYTAKLAPSSELENGDAIDNIAKIPSYYGVPKAEQKNGVEYRTYVGNESPVNLNVALPELSLKKTTGPNGAKSEKALIGEEFEWRLEAKNSSTVATLKGLDLTDVLPAHWKYVAGSAELTPGGTHPTPTATHTAPGEEEQLVWENVGDLGPNGVIKLDFKAIPTTELVGEEGIYTNHATAKGEDASGSGSRKVAGTVVPYVAKDTAQAELLTPPLTITKTPKLNEPLSEAIAGGNSAYTLEIVNSGAATATEVNVTDFLQLGQTYTPGSATASPNTGFGEIGSPTVETFEGESRTKVAWTIASIPKQGKVVITVPVSLSASLTDPTVLKDDAFVDSHQQPLPAHDEGGLNVSREADMKIVKTQIAPAAPAPAIPGETVEYNLRVENLGPSDAAAVKVTDPVPAGTEFASATSPCGLVGTEVVCELNEMAAGQAKDLKVTLKVLSSRTTTVVNKAKVTTTTTEPEGGGEPNESEATTPVKPQADLTVVKRGPGKPVLLGSTFEYEVEVTNAGPSDAAGVTITDPLPAQEEFASAEAPCEESAPASNVVTCAIGAIPVGSGPVKLHFTVKAIGIPVGGALVKNVATVTSTTENINPSKVGEVETTVLPAADLSIKKTAPATVAPDGVLTYGLQVENSGPSVAHKVTVTDPLPAGVEFVSASEGCVAAAGIVTCTVQPAGELQVEEEKAFQVTVQVPFVLGGEPLTNTASVKGEEADPNTENDSSTVTTTVGPAADLSIVKTMGKAQAGQPLTYTLAVSNKGPSTASAVTVKDTLPVGTTFKTAAPSQGTCGAAGQEVTCNLGALPAGGSAQVSITVGVGATVTGNLRNVAKVEGPEPDPDKSNNESTVEGPVAPPLPTTPNLKVTKTADTSTPQVGTPFDYHVTVSNIGGGEAKNVKVLDTLNGPVKVLSIETDSGKCEAAGSQITCNIASIPVGKTVHIAYSVVAEEAGPLSNTASAQAANGEKAPSNNHAVKSVKAKSGNAGKAGFILTKTASKKVVPGGKKVSFTITLRNGPVALVNATICDRLPAALVFIKAAGATFVHGEACWQKKYVAPKKTLKLHLTARAVRGYKPRKARNVASASAENAPRRKQASATVQIKPAFAGAPGGVTG